MSWKHLARSITRLKIPKGSCQRPPVIEMLEQRLLLAAEPVSCAVIGSVDPCQHAQILMPEIAGMAPIGTDPSAIAGQVIYIDTDGQDDLILDSPIELGPLDIKDFCLEGPLAGLEIDILDNTVKSLDRMFGQSGVRIVTDLPGPGLAFSTVWLSTDRQALDEVGGLLGLAEQIDVGNRSLQDKALVLISQVESNQEPQILSSIIADRIAHEIGHILGYVHASDATRIESGQVDLAVYVNDIRHLAYDAGVDDRYVTYGLVKEKIEARDTYVHQWIALEGWRFYSQQFLGAELGSFLGTIEGSNDDKWYPLDTSSWRQFTGDDLLEGVYEEDTLGIWLRHFVAGGDGMEITTGLSKIPDDDRIILQTLLRGAVTQYVVDPSDGAYLSAYEAAETLWQQAIGSYEVGSKALAYYYLGRVAHLLADMCVPAHVHLDRHVALQKDADFYEYNTSANKRFMLWGLDGERSGPTGQVRLYQGLEELFRATVNYTEEYPSWNLNGILQADGQDDPDIPNEGRHGPELVGSDLRWDMDDYWLVADDLMPWAMEQSAALYRLFYRQVDIEGPTIIMLTQLGDSENGAVVLSARLEIQAVVQDAVSGYGCSPLVVIEHKVGDQWVQSAQIAMLDGSVRLRLPDDGLYRAKVIAYDGAGNLTQTPWGYLQVQDALTCLPIVTVESLVTADHSPAISGTVDDPSASVEVILAGGRYAATANADGIWHIPAGLIGPLPAGRYDVIATAVDQRGNIGVDKTSDELWVVLLEERFEDQMTGWQVTDQGTRSRPSRWTVVDGQLVQQSNIYSLGKDQISRIGTFAAYEHGLDWTDYQVYVDLRSADDDDIGIMFRIKDSRNYYRFSWNSQTGFRRLVKCVDGRFELLYSDNIPYIKNQTYNVVVSAHGPLLQVYIHDELVLWAIDYTFTSGTVGLYCWGNQGSYFDNLIVEDLSGQDVPPLITGIHVEPSLIRDDQSAIVTVDVIDPDQDQQGLQYRWTCQDGLGRFADPDAAQTVFSPADIQSVRSVLLTVQVTDTIHAVSSSIELFVVDTDAQVLFSDGFDDGDLAGWSIVQEGSWPMRARWYLSGGAVVEGSGIARRNDGIAARGTYLLWDQGYGWDNYLVQVKMRSNGVDAMGLMFRYTDAGNFYRFSWNSRTAYARIVRCVDGRFDLVKSVSYKYSKGRTYTISVLAIGQQLRVFVDGSILLACQDGSLGSGSIALYSAANKGSIFDQITIYKA